MQVNKIELSICNVKITAEECLKQTFFFNFCLSVCVSDD